MKELNKEKGIRLYSFETNAEMIAKGYSIILPQVIGEKKEDKVLFSGTKAELFQKDEEFWKGILPVYLRNFFTDSKDNIMPIYKNYNGLFWFNTATESGISAIENCKEYIIITEEI